MRRLNIFHLLIILAFLQTACNSTKKITMFQDSYDNINRIDVPKKAQKYKIKPYDNLYLYVKTLDPEVNLQFDPSLKGDGISPGTQQMYGTPTSQYINGYRVSSDGTITLPILGKIKFAGLTLSEAHDLLLTKAKEYLKEPTVQLKLLNYKINLTGEVTSPGIYYNYEENVNILDAISMANGLTKFADIEKVLVKREDKNTIKTYLINFTDNSVFSSEAYYLQPNDIVYIPPNKLKRRDEKYDSYSQILQTISTIAVAVALFMNL